MARQGSSNRSSLHTAGGTTPHPIELLAGYPRLARRKAKLTEEVSSLGEIILEVERSGCNKRKAEILEKDLDKVENMLEEVTSMYDGAVESMLPGARTEAVWTEMSCIKK